MSASVVSGFLFISTALVAVNLVGCTAAGPKPAATVASVNATPTERLSNTDEKTAAVSEGTMSAPIAGSAMAPSAAPEADREPREPQPPGQLVCRATADGNAHQIFLEWNGDTAKGTLRTSTPSGMVRQEPIRAERYKARIIIDDPNSDDLAVHKATLVDGRKGKQLQMGDHTHGWTQCD